MGKIISVCNQKGGVGKTTTCVNLAAAFGILEKKVLVIDTDPQANASISFGFDSVKLNNPALQNVNFSAVIKTNIIKTNIVNVDLLPYFEDIDFFKDYSKTSRFKNALQSIKVFYDYIIIDCVAYFKTKNLDIVSNSDSIIIPVQCGFYALEGLHQFLKTVRYIQKNLNSEIEIEGFLLTMYDNRNNLSKQVLSYMQTNFKKFVFKTIIHRSSKITQAPSFGKSIIEYDIDCIGAQNYLALANEIITKESEKTNLNYERNFFDIPIKEENIFNKKSFITTSNEVNSNESVAHTLINVHNYKNTVRKITSNDFENLIGLRKHDIKNNFYLEDNKVESDIWVFKFKSKSFFRKKYLFLFFDKSIVKYYKIRRFKFFRK